LHKIITRLMKLLTRRRVLVEEEGSTYMADNDGDSDEARVLSRPCEIQFHAANELGAMRQRRYAGGRFVRAALRVEVPLQARAEGSGA
jgi:hypothetical protein